MSQPSMDVEGRKRWVTPALERLDLSGTRSGPITASAEFTFNGTPNGAPSVPVFHPGQHS